jgi:hypothetical protein
MHLPLLKALVVVIAASVVAIGAAVEPRVGNPQHAHGSAETTRTSTLESDGLEFLGQLAAGNVKADPSLKQSWARRCDRSSPQPRAH